MIHWLCCLRHVAQGWWQATWSILQRTPCEPSWEQVQKLLTSDVMHKLVKFQAFWNQPGVMSQIPEMAKVVVWVKTHYYGDVTDNKTLAREFYKMRQANRICVAMFKWVWFQVINFDQQISPLQELTVESVGDQ